MSGSEQPAPNVVIADKAEGGLIAVAHRTEMAGEKFRTIFANDLTHLEQLLGSVFTSEFGVPQDAARDHARTLIDGHAVAASDAADTKHLVSELQAKLNDAQEEIALLTPELSQANGQLEEARAKIAELEGTVAANAEKITELEASAKAADDAKTAAAPSPQNAPPQPPTADAAAGADTPAAAGASGVVDAGDGQPAAAAKEA